ncbi:MAG: hypothetical protein K0M45_04910 [Candidatus Paracaedibacteraceae bacterium]|nr:hypothetical protein [Candidatus Paracaedibacteraceae bacterium]
MWQIENILNTDKYSSQEILDLLRNKSNIHQLFLDFDPIKATEDTRFLTKYFVQELHTHFAKEEKTNLPLELFSRIYSPFLYYLIAHVYWRFSFNLISKKIEIYSSSSATTIESIACLPQTSEEFFKNIFSNKDLRLLIDLIILNKEIEAVKWTPLQPKVQPSQESNLKDKIINLINSVLPFKGVYGFSIYENIFLSAILVLKSFTLKSKKAITSREAVEDLNIEIYDPSLIQSIRTAISILLPPEFRTIFSRRKKFSFKNILRAPIIFDTVRLYYSDQVINYVAQQTHGLRICFAQHGGCYATFKNRLIPESIEFLCDTFFMWGDMLPHSNSCKSIKYAPSPMLSKVALKEPVLSKDIIFVGTDISPYWDAIVHPNPYHLGSYLQEKYNFLSNISSENFSTTFYKLYPAPISQDFNEEKFIKDLFPQLKLLNKSYHLEEKIAAAKIFVIDSIESTTFYKCMAANQPAICYNGLVFFELTDHAKQIYEELKEAKIVFETAVEAAEFLNSKTECINKWWDSTEVQMARKRFCDSYARTDKNYLWQWVKTLLKL